MAEYVALGLILTAALFLFWTQKLPFDLTAILVMVSLMVPWPRPGGEWRGILEYQEAFSGFGSPAVIMIVAMFVFGGALVRTGAAEWVGAYLFRAAASREWLLQITVLCATTLCSMFVNDTTVVLIFLPLILTICRERNLSPSRYLLFAAYGSLLGGQWTLIGTRSNILISDYYRQHQGAGLGFFDFTIPAIVIFISGALYLLLIGRRILPTTGPPVSNFPGDGEREYLTEVSVSEGASVIGSKLEQLPWAKRRDLTVVEILRGDQRLPRWFRLEAGDVLIIKGPAAMARELLQNPDFQVKDELSIDPKALKSVHLVMVEALLAPNSKYEGATLDEVDFRRHYPFTVLGISRHGTIMRRRLGEVPLHFGDYLLLLGNETDLPRLKANENLILLEEKSVPAIGGTKALTTILLLFGIIGTAVSGVLAPPISIPIAAVLAILLGCISLRDAYCAVDWQTVITLGGMISFGVAMETTGAASDLARILVAGLSDSPPIVILGSILLLAVILTQLVENAAAAIILAPLAYEVAVMTHLDPKPFMVALAVCVSSAFCTPVAHESTLLVLGPGGYRFKHYLQLGSVLAILTWLFGTLVTPMVWPFR